MHPLVKDYLDRVVIRDDEKWIDGDVNLYCLGLRELNFHDININGHFSCAQNLLETLDGSPKSCLSFWCSRNRLTSLKGSPEKVQGSFNAFDNKLENLEGLSESIGGVIYIGKNPLKSLKGIGSYHGCIIMDRTLDCDYFIQYSLMGMINLVMKKIQEK